MSMSRPAVTVAISDAGWLDGALRIESPNRDERPAGETVSLIVVHAISLPPACFGGDAIMRLFTNRLDAAAHPYFAEIAGLRVSAHFLIRRDGELIQFVSCRQRAWHAGPIALQRLLAWHRTRGLRRIPFRRGAVRMPVAAAPALVRQFSGHRSGWSQRHCSRPQDRPRASFRLAPSGVDRQAARVAALTGAANRQA